MDFEHIRSTGYVSTVEMAYIAHQLGYKITEIPIHFPDRTQGKSKMSFRIQIEAAYRVWQIRQLHHNLTPDMRLTEKDTTLRKRQQAVMPKAGYNA
jgi:dolichol-phosphate mannosyltransferase